MKIDQQAVFEVFQDGEVSMYESSFSVDDAATFIDQWGPMEDRNFFLAIVTLTPIQES